MVGRSQVELALTPASSGRIGRVLLVSLALFSGLLFFREVIHGLDDWNFNQAMRRGDLDRASNHPSDYGRFAKAQKLRQQEKYTEAQDTFAQMNIEPGQPLRAPALFELAENYVTQSVAHERRSNEEQGIPLMELAKENYRNVLSLEPENWAARENLAKVLLIQPDARLLVDEQEDIMPERSPQAPVQTMGHDRLP